MKDTQLQFFKYPIRDFAIRITGENRKEVIKFHKEVGILLNAGKDTAVHYEYFMGAYYGVRDYKIHVCSSCWTANVLSLEEAKEYLEKYIPNNELLYEIF